jgi:hypothetical protein
MIAARRALLAAQLLALGGPMLLIMALLVWTRIWLPNDAIHLDSKTAATLGYFFALAAVQGVGGAIWSFTLIYTHVDLRYRSNYQLLLMSALIGAFFSLILFEFFLPRFLGR